MDLKGSVTEKNLYRTFAGESRARTKYNIYAERARQEGYQWIAKVFDETASNELAHGRVALGLYLKQVNSTQENLISCMLGEAAEYKDIYVNFAKEAEAEGFVEIADFFKDLVEVEESHYNKFKELSDKLSSGTMFTGRKNSKWVCLNCGYIYEGEAVPMICPLCQYPKGYFQPLCEEEKV